MLEVKLTYIIYMKVPFPDIRPFRDIPYESEKKHNMDSTDMKLIKDTIKYIYSLLSSSHESLTWSRWSSPEPDASSSLVGVSR